MTEVEAEDDTASIDARVELADGVFSWCVRNVSKQGTRGSGEHAIQWALIAGEVAGVFCTSKLADEDLESSLRAIGNNLATTSATLRVEPEQPLRWLHVLTRCYETGGHTALCRRWLELDASSDRHSIVLTFQTDTKIPESFREAVAGRGGDFHVLDSAASLTDRATALRQLSWQADVVVLHTHMWDPLATVAFAVPGGPPVFLANHADHVYWTGASVADLILNIRPSGEALCSSHRGNSRSLRFPIPIPAPKVLRGDPQGELLRNSLHIPPSALVFLTVGSAYKYIPTKDMNFLEAARKILEVLPESFLVAVGPRSDDPHWEELARHTRGRVIAVGEQSDLNPYFATADVYLEGFPFGSLTALLEAVLAGILPILAPECCPLPYRSDDFSLNNLVVPKDPQHYVQMAIALGSKATLHGIPSDDLRRATLLIHCEPDWSRGLLELRKIICSGLKHNPAPLSKTERLNKSVIRYWARFSSRRSGNDNAFGYAFRRAMDEGLHPRLDCGMFQGLCLATNSGLKVASPVKSYLASILLSLLPARMAKRLYLRF